MFNIKVIMCSNSNLNISYLAWYNRTGSEYSRIGHNRCNCNEISIRYASGAFQRWIGHFHVLPTHRRCFWSSQDSLSNMESSSYQICHHDYRFVHIKLIQSLKNYLIYFCSYKVLQELKFLYFKNSSVEIG